MGIGDLGIGSGLSRFLPEFYAKGQENHAMSFLKTAFFFQLKIVTFLSLGIIILSKPFSLIILKNEALSPLFIMSAFGVVGIIVLAFITFSLSAQKKFDKVAIINTFSTLIKFILILWLFSISQLNLFTATTVFLLSFFIALIFSLRYISVKFLKVKERKGNLKKLLSYSLYLGVSRLFSATSSKLDSLMLIPLSSSHEAGIYSGAFKIATVYIMLAGSFSMVIAPRLSSFGKLSEAVYYFKKVILVVMGILATIIFMYFIAPWFIVFVLGSQYVESVPVFRFLLLPMALFTATIPSVNFLLYFLSKPQVSTFNTFVSLLIIIFGNLVFIPAFGRFGPAITLTLAYSFTLISSCSFAIYFYRRRKYD